MRVRHPWENECRRAATLMLIAGILAMACAPAVPAPTAAPAGPAEAAKPAAGATTAPAKPAQAAKPAAGAQAAGEKVQAKGSITIVIETDPDTIQLKDATTDNAYFVLGNVYDALTARDWSSGEPKIVGKLAESFSQSQTDPRTWRFKLRPGLKFTNGEPVNADAVVHMVSYVVNPAQPGNARDEFGLAEGSATKIDDLTVDITTKAPDAIFPSRMVKMPIPAPEWLKKSPQDASITEAVGSGPYKLVEYVKASHFLLQANEEYWGTPKPTIAEVKIVFRNEAAVRYSMLQAGEVQLATLLTPEDARQLPKHLVELTGESVGVRINMEHPVLKDLRVRQAINMSIDRKSLIDALYGDVAEPLNGMMVRKSSVGWNPSLKEYPYDPARAKQLIQEAGATGQSIELISRNGIIPRVSEVTELLADQISQTGLKVSVRSLEVAQWLTVLRQVKPGDVRSDLQLTAASDPVLDSSRVLNSYYRCGGVSSAWCDQAWTDKFSNVLGLGGEARVKGFQELWATAYDQNVFIPLFGLNFIHGISPKLQWGPVRQDLIRDFTEWRLDD